MPFLQTLPCYAGPPQMLGSPQSTESVILGTNPSPSSRSHPHHCQSPAWAVSPQKCLHGPTTCRASLEIHPSSLGCRDRLMANAGPWSGKEKTMLGTHLILLQTVTAAMSPFPSGPRVLLQNKWRFGLLTLMSLWM